MRGRTASGNPAHELRQACAVGGEGAGKPFTFIVATALVIVRGVSGAIFGFSHTWELVINTGTTIVTFLMVYLIQSTRNRDTDALQVSVNGLLRVTHGARLALLNLEEIKAGP